MRSQDVIHSAFMPHFRAQMNCVPGMITEFAFTPVITTDEMRQKPEIIEKVKKINKIREENSKELIANGEEPLDPYVFDYLLLCNKICGASHYNMQMKIVVETPEEYQNWSVKILCSDCHNESNVNFHIIGLKCQSCAGYNTRRIGNEEPPNSQSE